MEQSATGKRGENSDATIIIQIGITNKFQMDKPEHR